LFYLKKMEMDARNLPINGRIKARAAMSNRTGRFEPYQRETFQDGWEICEDEQRVDTVIRDEKAKTILTKNDSPDISFDRSINPYRGCEHGCIYCFARPTHAYLGMSPGLDFETQLIAKTNAADLLRKEMSRKGYCVKPIAIGTNTDPYQPIEKQYRVMRSVLETLLHYNHPVSIVTKGALIARDIDILAKLAARNLLNVGISITTLNARLSRSMEPRAPTPERRLRTIAELAQAGIPVRAMVAPVVPMLTDHEMEQILTSAAVAGARAASWIMLRLPNEVSPLFHEWLHRTHPDRADRIMNRVREMHDGKDYSPQWGRRMRGEGNYAQLIAHRFEIAARRLKLDQDLPELCCSKFQVPGRGTQLSLF
jgi:DNA repair photolyase